MSEKRQCKCGDKLRTISSRAVGEQQLRYMQCRKCGARCKCVVKADAVFRRVLR
jgi:hypothetical protein